MTSYQVRIATTDRRAFGNAVKTARGLEGVFDPKTKTWLILNDNPIFRVERRYDSNFDAVAYLAGRNLMVVEDETTTVQFS